MKHIRFARTSSLLLTLLLFLSFPFSGSAVQEEEKIYVLTASDFQQGSHEGSSAIVSGIAQQIVAAGYTDIDGFLFAGDYDRNTIGSSAETKNGLDALDATIDSVFPGIGTKIYVQGNHDPASVEGLSAPGAHETENYSVYVIRNDDYMWYNSNQSKIRETGDALAAYLDEKAAQDYVKPIFVISHLPLHYSMRTSVDGDAQYANYIFDPLNEAGALGLNIVFLYGHDHSHGWDNYLGGSAIFLTRGDKINIAQASRSVFKEETLNFTYMNAGYTGYYSSANGADDALTMCLFEIGGESLTVRRFDSSGLHVLKNAGTYCSEYDDRAILPSNKTVVNSPADITVSQTVLHKNWYEDDATGVAAYYTGSGIDVLEDQSAETEAFFGDPEAFCEYIAYTVSPVGENIGSATVRVPLDGLTSEPVRAYIRNGETFTRIDAAQQDGRVSFAARLPVTVVLAVPNDPVARSAYSDLLFLYEETEGVSLLQHALDGKYLTCDGNATFGDTGAPLTLTANGEGFSIALARATGGKAAGDALHFGTANRCSFGTASPFIFYEFKEGDLFFPVTEPENGKVYMIAYKTGGTNYALTGTVNGSGSSARIETKAVTVTVSDPDRTRFESSAYLPYLYKVASSGDELTFKHIDTASYLGCEGNATLSSTPAKFTVSPYGDGVKIALSESIGGKSAGEALHVGSGDRISYGTASVFSIYEYVGNEEFKKVETPSDGSFVVFVYEGGNGTLAVTGRVYNPGASSRIETETVALTIAKEYSPMDLNRDGAVSINDVSVLLDFLSGKEDSIPEGADPDVSGNGVTSIVDVSVLLNYLSLTA